MEFTKQRSRRIYCKTDRRYWTADEVFKVIRMGIEVRIICVKTRNDITREYLAQNLGKLNWDLNTILKAVRI